jgi:hypothetical protein
VDEFNKLRGRKGNGRRGKKTMERGKGKGNMIMAYLTYLPMSWPHLHCKSPISLFKSLYFISYDRQIPQQTYILFPSREKIK